MTDTTQQGKETQNGEARAPAARPKRPLYDDVADVTRLIENFRELLSTETEALKAADFRTVDSLQPPKRDMARQYQAQVTSLSSRAGEAHTLDSEAKARLVRARTSFTVVLADNLRALEATKESTRRLVGRMLDAARRSVVDGKQTNYSATGRAQAYKSSTMSLAVDQKL